MSEGVASSRTLRVLRRMLMVVASTNRLKTKVQMGSMMFHSGLK